MMISPGVFSFFSKLRYSGLLVGKRTKKWVKMIKNSNPCAPYLMNYTSYHLNDISRCFFHFFKILIFQVVSGVKGQKVTQKDK